MREQPFGLASARFSAGETVVTTLFELVGALVDTGAGDAEVIATLRELVNSGRVRLVGEFREPHIEESWTSH